MKELLFVFLLSFSLLSCNSNNKKVVYTSPEQLALAALEAVRNNDTLFIKTLLPNLSDTLMIPKELIVSFKNQLEDTVRLNRFFARFNEDMVSNYKKAKELGVDWENIKVGKVETDSFYTEKWDTYECSARLFFTSNKKEYFLKFSDMQRLDTKLIGLDFDGVFDLEKRKEEIGKQTYQPRNLTFKSCDWETKGYTPKKFEHFFVSIENTDQKEFDYIKYRVSIFDASTGKWELDREKIFSKTYEYRGKIYPNDILRLEIPDLKNYFLNIDLSDKDNFSWRGEILDASPKPEYMTRL